MAFNISKIFRGLGKTGEVAEHVGADVAKVAPQVARGAAPLLATRAIPEAVEGAGTLAAHSGEQSLLRRIGLEVHKLEGPHGPMRVSIIGRPIGPKTRESLLSHVRTLMDDSPEAMRSLGRIQFISGLPQDEAAANFLRPILERDGTSWGTHHRSFGNRGPRQSKIRLRGDRIHAQAMEVKNVIREAGTVPLEEAAYHTAVREWLEPTMTHGPASRLMISQVGQPIESVKAVLSHEWGHALHNATSSMNAPLMGMTIKNFEDFLPPGFSNYASGSFTERNLVARQVSGNAGIFGSLRTETRDKITRLHANASKEPIADLYAAVMHEPERVTDKALNALHQTLGGSSKRVADELARRKPRVPGGASTLRRMGLPGA